MSTHLDNADDIYFWDKEKMIFYSIEQNPGQGSLQRNKSLRRKIYLRWIKLWGTQFPI